jgi:glutamate/tyrosine decarboxylase-like PLP-dependent enzyme
LHTVFVECSKVVNGVTNGDLNHRNEILYKVIPLVDQYLKEYSNSDSKVVDFQLPDELKKKIDFEVREEGVSEDVLLDLVKKAMKYSVHTCHPRFSNCLWSGVSPVAVAAQTVVAATNTSMYTYEMAPVYNLMEQELIRKLCGLIGFEDGDGIFTPGGSISNMFGLLAARYKAFPESKEKGIRNLPQMVIFTSAEAHYSTIKSAFTMGMGSENVVKIKTDDR